MNKALTIMCVMYYCMLRCQLFFFNFLFLFQLVALTLLRGALVNSCPLYLRQFHCENCKSVLVCLLLQDCIIETTVHFVIHCVSNRAGLSDVPQLYLFIYLLVFLPFLGLLRRHMEVPRLGVQSELQPLAYTRATATWDPSCIFDLHHSSQLTATPDR